MTSVDDLIAFIMAAPSPYHAAAEAAARLTAVGFTEVALDREWPTAPGGYLVVRGGAMIAWMSAGPSADRAPAPFRIVGAHTDSPNLRLKPHPDTGGSGWKQIAVEVYGGALWNSWLDRDLGLSGRVVLRDRPHEPLLVHVDEPLCRVPQLAVHLDREVNTKGVALNPQDHLTPVWGLGTPHRGEVATYLAQVLSDPHDQEISPSDIASWDLMLHDVTPPARLGRTGDLLAAARLDNLASCWAAVTALTQVGEQADPPVHIPVVALYDHEEVGSTSATGADGELLAQVLERIVAGQGGDRAAFLRALAGSACVSADMAHATHPNYPERHDPGHPITVNGGPVIKVNANQRYATEAATAAMFAAACDAVDAPVQWFVGRNDQPCGSTIGPATAAHLGVPTVDVGIAQLSMHSARELCGTEDPPQFAQALGAFLAMAPTATG